MRRYRSDIKAGLVVFAAVLVLGVPAGILWEAITPKVQVVARGGITFYAQPEGSASITADGNFALIGVAAGVICACAAFARYRHNGVATVLGLVAGGVLASLLAYRIGHLLGPDDLREGATPPAGDGVPFSGPLRLRAHGVLLLWALASTTVFLALTASRDPDEEPAPAGRLTQPGTAPDPAPDAGPYESPGAGADARSAEPRPDAEAAAGLNGVGHGADAPGSPWATPGSGDSRGTRTGSG